MSSRIRSLVALVTLALAVPMALATGVSPAAAAPVPRSGFVDAVVTGVPNPTDVADLPDGRLLITSQGGELWVVATNGTRVATPALDLAVCNGSEQGLLGVEVDPEFATNSYVYVFYTLDSGGCRNRVVRYTLTGNTVNAGSATVLIDNMLSNASNHEGGDVQFGRDGLLYISSGDDANPANARDRSNLLGKILRITRDGAIPPGNPYTGSGTARCNTGATTSGTLCQEIVAYGLRNPFRIASDQNTAGLKMFVNDVGGGAAEEIDQLAIGADFGWDVREGLCALGSRTNCGAPPPGMTNPIFDYGHQATGCRSITGGAFVPNAAWPDLAGGYLYADYVCGKIFLLREGAGGWTSEDFVTGVGGVTSMRTVQQLGVASVLYTTAANGGELRRITATTGAGTTDTTRFHPLSPRRVLDTRDGTGYTGRKPAGGETLTVKVTGGTSGVPDQAVAVAINFTGTEATAEGFVTVWPTGEARPVASNLNFSRAGDTVANASILRLGTGGQVNLFTQNGGHFVADVTGYWTETEQSQAGRFEPVANPGRLLDTRIGTGAPTGIVGAGGSLDLQVTGAGGVPATGVEAVALVLTVTNTATSGFVTAWPTGQARPTASSINPVGAGDIRSNLVILPVGTGGKVSLYTLQATHLVVDVAGWFTDGSAPLSSSGLMIATSPIRVTDTRNNVPFGRLNGGDTGILDYSVLTSNAKAIVTNLTVDATQSPGFLTAWPANQPVPTASNVNWSAANQTRAGLALSSLAADGEVAYRPNVATHFVVDVSAWFVA